MAMVAKKIFEKEYTFETAEDALAALSYLTGLAETDSEGANGKNALACANGGDFSLSIEVNAE